MRRIETNDWWPNLLALKDEMSLRELSARFKVTPSAISAGLKRTGVERKATPPGPRSSRKQENLPPEPDEVQTVELSSPPGASAIAPFVDLLGQVSDRVVAEKAGVTVSAVTQYRQRRGIASSQPKSKKARGHRPVLLAQPKTLNAWIMTGSADDFEVPRVIVAESLSHAAAIAEEQKLPVSSLTFIGQVI